MTEAGRGRGLLDVLGALRPCSVGGGRLLGRPRRCPARVALGRPRARRRGRQAALSCDVSIKLTCTTSGSTSTTTCFQHQQRKCRFFYNSINILAAHVQNLRLNFLKMFYIREIENEEERMSSRVATLRSRSHSHEL